MPSSTPGKPTDPPPHQVKICTAYIVIHLVEHQLTALIAFFTHCAEEVADLEDKTCFPDLIRITTDFRDALTHFLNTYPDPKG